MGFQIGVVGSIWVKAFATSALGIRIKNLTACGGFLMPVIKPQRLDKCADRLFDRLETSRKSLRCGEIPICQIGLEMLSLTVLSLYFIVYVDPDACEDSLL